MRERLRQAFEAQAARVEPAADALSTIRTRIQHQRRLRRRIAVSLTSISSAAVATVTAVLVGTTSCVAPTVPTPPPGGSPTTAPPTSPSAGQVVSLPVYYLGTVRNRVVLYREFHPATLADTTVTGRISAALAEMLRGDPFDPDYTSAWPAGATVRGVRIEDGVAIVDLGGVGTNSVGAETAAMTIEQLVWTVTAVAADAGSPLDGVRLLVDGSSRAELWGHVAVGGVLRRGPANQTQAPVWLISPQHGATVGRTFRVHLDGAVFEATAHLTVRNARGDAVFDQVVTFPVGAPGRGEAFVEVTLPPGAYTVQAYYFSAADGTVQGMDDHDITVSG